jgi:DNA-binding CsgD family transcriptional regulator
MADNALALATMPDQPLTRLAANRLLGEIETAARNYAAAEGHLMAAIDLSIACEVPCERARTLLALAALRCASGPAETVVSLLDEIRHICTPLGATPLLVRADALLAGLGAELPRQTDVGGLTARELEVLRLLPRGLTNAEIADALFVSPRTVQTHLSNLYTKLNVRGRAEAVAYAVGSGLV